MIDCRFNCSSVYGRDRKDVRIWHFHGDKHVVARKGLHLWWPQYEECLRQNLARIREWTPCGDRRLAKYLEIEANAPRAESTHRVRGDDVRLPV